MTSRQIVRSEVHKLEKSGRRDAFHTYSSQAHTVVAVVTSVLREKSFCCHVKCHDACALSSGITGTVSIDENGDRNADYSLLDMNEDGEFEVHSVTRV